MKKSPAKSKVLRRSVEHLKINKRSLNCLKAENILTIGDLVRCTEIQLLRAPNMGKHSLNDIKAALARQGLALNTPAASRDPGTRDTVGSARNARKVIEQLPTRASLVKLLYCSFCGKSQHEVRKLIAGHSVFVCDECVELCNKIIQEERPSE